MTTLKSTATIKHAARNNAAKIHKTSKNRGHNIAIISFAKYVPELSMGDFVEHIPEDLYNRLLVIEPEFGSGIVVYRSSKPVIDHKRLASFGSLEVIGVVGENTLCGYDIVVWLNSHGIHPQHLPVLCEIEEKYLLNVVRLMSQEKGFTTP
jgi:hypothetical protein